MLVLLKCSRIWRKIKFFSDWNKLLLTPPKRSEGCYGPWIVSSGKKSNTTTIVSDRRRIWSDHIFLFQTFVTQTFERLLGLFFSFVKKWKFWKSWKSFRDVSKFNLLNYCISYVTLAFQNHIKIFVISNNLYVLSLNIQFCKDKLLNICLSLASLGGFYSEGHL